MTVARFSLLALLVLIPLPTAALPDDGTQPIEVEADRLELRDGENISIYEGNVSLKQGSLEISSDRLVIRFNDRRELELMEMTGAPARFRQLIDDNQEMRGQARRIHYTESKSLLELFDEARFSQGGDTIESDLIRINTETNAIEAGDSDSAERVKMLIQPRRDAGAGE